MIIVIYALYCIIEYYNKDLDLEEDQVPVVINELNESAMNFISQEQYEKALILLQKA